MNKKLQQVLSLCYQIRMTVERAQAMYDTATKADDKVQAASVLTARTKQDALCVLTRAKVSNGVKLENKNNLEICELIEK